MQIFVHTTGKILFIECESVSTFQEIKDEVIRLSSSPGTKILYLGKEVDYQKKLKEYNINHTGYVVKWV
eukprot:gene2359-2827_t